MAIPIKYIASILFFSSIVLHIITFLNLLEIKGFYDDRTFIRLEDTLTDKLVLDLEGGRETEREGREREITSRNNEYH